MKVAVVILNWNGEQMLRQFLPSVVKHSILPETLGEAVVYVADNGSTDGSLALLDAEFPMVRTIIFEENYGFADGYNRAFEQIDAEYAVLLNSDVEVTEGWLVPLVEYMDEHLQVGACQPKLMAYHRKNEFEYAGAMGGFLDRYGYPYCRGRIFDTLEKDHGQYDADVPLLWATGACLMVRLATYKEVGGLDGRFFAHMEEIDLQWRMQLAGWRIMVEPRAKVYHLGGGTLPPSPTKIYLNHRNNLAMLYKCSSPLQRLVVAVVRPFTDAAEALGYILKLQPRKAWAIVRAWGSFIAWHKMLASKRKAVVRTKKVENIYSFSIVLRYLFGARRFKNMM